MKIKFDDDASKREAQRIKSAVKPSLHRILSSCRFCYPRLQRQPRQPAARSARTPIVFDLNGRQTEVEAFGDGVPALRNILSRELRQGGGK